MLWSAGLTHLVSGNVDFGLMATILLGSLPGVWIGASLVGRVPAAVLRVLLGCVLLASSLGVMSKAGVNLPPWSILVVPSLAGGAAWVLTKRRLKASC